MKMIARTVLSISVIINFFLISSCNDNSSSTATSSKRINPSNTAPVTPSTDGPAIATVTATSYTLKIHKATSFIPQNEPVGTLKPKPGNRFIVLDMSVKNISADKEVDMGQILLTTRIIDEKGTDVPLQPEILAIWSMEHPDPGHQVQYESIWNTLQPGSFYRTEAYGIEAPVSSKHFTIIMKDNAKTASKTREIKVDFSTE